MYLGSYTVTVLKEESDHFKQVYNREIAPLLSNSARAAEVALLEMKTQIDPSASSFSLQIKFDSEENYSRFSTHDFPEVLKLLDVLFPQRYAYFHTLLEYI